MKNKLLKLLAALIVTFSLVSCGTKSLEVAQYIPKKSNAIIVFDQKRMNEKLKANNYSIDSFFNAFSSTVDSAKVKKLMQANQQNGMKQDEKTVLFFTQSGSAFKGNSIMQFNIISSIENVANFENYIKSIDEFKTAPIIKNNKYNAIQVGDYGVISWNKDVAIFAFGFNTSPKNLNDTIASLIPKSNIVISNEIQKNLDGFYNLSTEERVSSVEVFNDMFNKSADAYMFSGTNGFSELSGMSVMPKLEELLADNFSISYLNFEEGKIVAETTNYFNDQLASLLKQYGDGNISFSSIENFPANKTNAAFLVSFKPDMIQGILKELQLETLIDAFFSKMNFRLQDLYKCFKGNMSIALGDLTFENKSDSSHKAKMNFLFNAEINDKLSLKKVLSKAVEDSFLVEQNGVYTLSSKLKDVFPYYLRIDDKNFTIAENENMYSSYNAKKIKTQINNAFVKKAEGKSMAFYLDINSIFTSASQFKSKSESVNNMVQHAANTFDNVTAITDHVKDGKLHSTIELKLKNEKENSLVTLTKLMQNIVKDAKGIQEEIKSDTSKVKNFSMFGMIID